jgi:hypothetical protein
MLSWLALPALVRAGEIDTEHLFGFLIGSDVGNVGEREFQSQTAARLSRAGGYYRALGQQFELEFVPARDLRVELGTTFAAHDIGRVAGLADRSQQGWQGLTVDLRYRLFDRAQHPFGLTLAVEADASRIDDVSGRPARGFSSAFTLALDRELIPGDLVAALNVTYQPEWTRLVGTTVTERDATIGLSGALMAQLRPGFLFGRDGLPAGL